MIGKKKLLVKEMKENVPFNKIKHLIGDLTKHEYLKKLNFTYNGRYLFDHEDML